jgi:site-specific DNA recombinase
MSTARGTTPLSTGGVGTRETTQATDQPRAVMYLRVSSISQVNTDYDPEGLSIPAQREACLRKAAQMGVTVIDEYVEPGRSATSMDKRLAFQAMLQRIRHNRDVEYVIVYKLSRMNRNRVDDAMVLMSLRKYSVSLVSATESIDDTPVGQLVHGILATINEFRSAEDGADIRYKMGEKAKRGGTLGRAPLGYCNVREDFEGREIRTVVLDEERAPFIRVAFELYATGEYSLERLAEELTDRGFRTRPGKHPAGPVSDSKLATMLRDRYYLGHVTYQGVEYDGRHEALVSPELFEHVQLVLDTRQTSGERLRQYTHYLKGSVWCGRCYDEGRQSRLVHTRAVGRHGGEYFYFFCTAKQRHFCSSRYMAVEDVEDEILKYYATLKLTTDFIDAVRSTLNTTVAAESQSARLLRKELSKQLAKLDRQEENLLDLAADEGLPQAKLRERLRRIRRKRESLERGLADSEKSLAVGVQLYEAALSLLTDPYELYRQAGPNQRRLLNQALFEKLYIDDGRVTAEELAEPFRELVQAQRAVLSDQDDTASGWDTPATGRESETDLFVAAIFGGGSNSPFLVEVMGLEPTTSTLRT